MSYTVCNLCTHTDNHSATRHYPQDTMGYCTNLLLATFFWGLTVLPWRLQGFTPWSKTQPQSCFSLNDMAIHIYFINTELYLTFSKYGDKLLCGEKFDKYFKITIFQHYFLFIFFHRYLRLNESLNRHALTLFGVFIGTFAWDRIKV